MSCITVDGDTLVVRTSPGVCRWTREENGPYAYGRGVFGGSSTGHHSAAEIADILVRRYPDDYLQALITLGWHDVIDAAKAVVERMRQEKTEKRISELPGEIADLRGFLAQHAGWDYQRFRKKVYDDAVAAGIGDDEMSVQRHHVAASSQFASLTDGPERIAELIAELERLTGSQR